MIMRAASCVTVSSTWLAKNINATSMMANSRPKKIGATSANSTAAEPRRLRLNRRNADLVKAMGCGIKRALGSRDLGSRDLGNRDLGNRELPLELPETDC